MITFKQKEAKKELRRLRNIANKAVDAGLRKVAAPARDQLKGVTPVESAILKKGVGIKNLNRKEKYKYGINKKDRAVKIGYVRNTKDAKLRQLEKKITLPALASILSYGAKPHEIKAKGKVLKFGDDYTKKIDHPGVKGSGFLQKYFAKMDSFSEDLFYQGISEYMKKHAS